MKLGTVCIINHLKKETHVLSVTNNACINWFVRTYFHQVIFYYYLTFSRLTPPNSKVRLPL